MVLIKVYADSFISFKEVDLDQAYKIKDHIEYHEFYISDLNINLENPLMVEIIIDADYIDHIKDFFNDKSLFDDKKIIKCIEEDILNNEYINKLRSYIELFPEYSYNIRFILLDWFADSFDESGEYEYIDHEGCRDSVDNLIGILILIHLKSISSDMSSIIASYLDIENFRSILYKKHPKLFSIKLNNF